MFMDIGGGIRLRVYDSRKENILQEKKKLSLYIWVNITSTFGPNPKPLYRKSPSPTASVGKAVTAGWFHTLPKEMEEVKIWYTWGHKRDLRIVYEAWHSISRQLS